MTSRERLVVVTATIITAASRLLARAKSPWDWDEILFALGMRDFDVVNHHPHPLGFPLYIVAAKAVHLLGLTDFRSLQTVNVIASMLIVPVMYFFCRELGLRFGTSLSAAVLLAFLPNVWFFGGTAFSDVPSMVLVLASATLLLRGSDSATAFLGGAALLGVAAGFRPQNLMIGGVAALVSTVHLVRARRYARVAVAVAIGAAIVIATYAGAAIATGDWHSYSEAIRVHREFIATHDSYAAPLRPALLAVADDFFVRPFRANELSVVITICVVIAMIHAFLRRPRGRLIAIASFLPFWVIAWLTLDYHSTSRFSIAWMPLVAILTADALWLVRNRFFATALNGALVVALIVWTLPALRFIRTHASPPVEAVGWIRANVPPGESLYVHNSMRPYAEYFLPQYRQQVVDGPPLARFASTPAHYLTERDTEADGLKFTFPRGRLWDLVRRRYFTITVAGVDDQPKYADGWYDEEQSGAQTFRWMKAKSVTLLPRVSQPARLWLRFATPGRGLQGVPSVSFSLNGALLGRVPGSSISQEVTLDAPHAQSEQSNVLVIETDRTVNPSAVGVSGDSRDLGVRLEALEWTSIDP